MPFRESGDRIEGHATITDGDTIKIAGRRIRLHGIEAPESEQRCQDSAGASPAGPGEGRELAFSKQSAQANRFRPFLFEKGETTCSAKLLSLPRRHEPFRPGHPQLNRSR